MSLNVADKLPPAIKFISTNFDTMRKHWILLLTTALCRQVAAADLVCRVLLVDVDAGLSPLPDDDKQIFRCETDASEESDGAPGMVYAIDFPASFLREHAEELETSEAYVTIPQGRAMRGDESVAPYISYPANATLAVIPSAHRKLSTVQLEGVSRVLVVRVAALDSTLAVSDEVVAGRIFGLGPLAETVNVVSQYGNCSFGKLQFVPAQGPDIVNGVGQLSINRNFIGVDTSTFENALTALTEAKFGNVQENFEHVLYCLPSGTTYGYSKKSDWFAYAYLRSWRSYYNDEFCGSFSGVMHELGHNLNLRHSDSGTAYGDKTGLMGISTSEVGGPASCFNGNKNWYLGWFEDKAIEIGWDKPWGGYLFAFTDYDITPDYGVVIIKVGNVFLQYNRAKSFNSGTRARRDSVTVVYNTRPTAQSILSSSIAFPLKAQSATVTRFRNWELSGHTLIIQACQTIHGPPDAVRMSIHLEGVHQSTCNTNLYSDAPSYAPTFSPTVTVPVAELPVAECEDDPHASFWVNEEQAVRMKCLQLDNSIALKTKVCQLGHPAWDLCPDSCRKCLDDCFDSKTDGFYINEVQGHKDCDWLARRPGWQTSLCKPGSEAFENCGETCNRCEPGSTPVPSVTPTTMTPTGSCEDSEDTFVVDTVERDCSWLARNALQHRDTLCQPGQEARDICPELCGVCTDFCFDDPNANIFINNVLGHQDCAWLSVRPGIADKLCKPGSVAFISCGETCNSC